jgi:hypothetical protein
MHFLASPAHEHRRVAGIVVECLQTSAKAFPQNVGGGNNVDFGSNLGLKRLEEASRTPLIKYQIKWLITYSMNGSWNCLPIKVDY